VTVDDVERAVLDAYEVRQGALDAATLDRARRLEPRHEVAVSAAAGPG
jgi:hypothetical protein